MPRDHRKGFSAPPSLTSRRLLFSLSSALFPFDAAPFPSPPFLTASFHCLIYLASPSPASSRYLQLIPWEDSADFASTALHIGRVSSSRRLFCSYIRLHLCSHHIPAHFPSPRHSRSPPVSFQHVRPFHHCTLSSLNRIRLEQLLNLALYWRSCAARKPNP